MFKNFKELLSLFTTRDRYQIYLLLLSTSVLGLIEMAGVASVMPFIAVVIEPQLIETNRYLNWVFTTLEFESTNQFLIFLGSAAFVVLLVRNGLATLDAWVTFRFCYFQKHKLSKRLLQKYLGQSYAFFLQRSTAELSKIVLSEVERIIIGTLMAGIGLFSDLVATAFIVALLLFIDPWVTLSTLVVLGGVYTVIFLLIQKKVSLLGQEFVVLRTEIFKRTKEALEGIKEIKVLGREAYFVDQYAKPDHRAAANAVRYNALDLIPQQGLETVAFGGIIFITLYFIITAQQTGQVVPLVALYAFAAYRLIPALKDIFDGVETIRYNAAALDEVWRDFTDSSAVPPRVMPPQAAEPSRLLKLSNHIELRDVTYCYPDVDRPAVENLAFSVQANATTCFIGSSGAGKSTTIDLILGLLTPTSGQIAVDGVAVNAANVQGWRRNIGYVPQAIYLTDDTIANNIALGIPEDEVDFARLIEVAEIANIHHFILRELKDRYRTIVGERGLRLSGGQRQRIGIARALYHDPEVLILDEATSALDTVTEAAIVESLLALRRAKTILFVSHRPSIAAKCDDVIVFSEGKVLGQGSYAELAAADVRFRRLLKDA